MENTKLQNKFVDACYYGDWHKVALYLKKGANPNEPDSRSYYPLHMACQEGHFRVVSILVKNAADINAKDEDGKGETALFRAIGAGHLRIVKYLIKNGCNVNLRRGGRTGDTPLHIACGWGRFKEMVELIKAGANIQAQDADKHRPIYYAVAHGHPKIVAFLINCGALATNKADSIKILLGIAISNKDKKMLKLLKTRLGPSPQPQVIPKKD